MKSITQWVKESRETFLDRFHNRWEAAFFSAEALTLDQLIKGLTAKETKGKTLDAGCGRSSWRGAVEAAGGEYESIDVQIRGGIEPTFLGDLCNMSVVESNRYQTVMCHQVLEHIATPHRVADEFYRVLCHGGHVIVTVPHLSRYHELPHDYYRYTEYGLRAVFEGAGFKTKEIGSYGGILSFLHHQFSFLFPGLVVGFPIIGKIALVINSTVSFGITKLEKMSGSVRMPLGCFGVFEKVKERTKSP